MAGIDVKHDKQDGGGGDGELLSARREIHTCIGYENNHTRQISPLLQLQMDCVWGLEVIGLTHFPYQYQCPLCGKNLPCVGESKWTRFESCCYRRADRCCRCRSRRRRTHSQGVEDHLLIGLAHAFEGHDGLCERLRRKGNNSF